MSAVTPSLIYTVTPQGFPYGAILCMGCDSVIPMGGHYTLRAEGMMGDTPVTESVCLRCGGIG